MRHIAATLTDVACELVDAPEPGAALLDVLTVAADQRRRHDLTFLQSVSGDEARVTEVRDQLWQHLAMLVRKAQTAGGIRPDGANPLPESAPVLS